MFLQPDARLSVGSRVEQHGSLLGGCWCRNDSEFELNEAPGTGSVLLLLFSHVSAFGRTSDWKTAFRLDVLIISPPVLFPVSSEIRATASAGLEETNITSSSAPVDINRNLPLFEFTVEEKSDYSGCTDGTARHAAAGGRC